MPSIQHYHLIEFLQQELAIPADAIAIALRHPEITTHLLPMVLWQYGLITIDQLDRVFEWWETAKAWELNDGQISGQLSAF